MDITSEKLFTKGDIAMLSTAQFDTLAAKYMDTIYRFAFSWLKSHADADDVTQNVLLALYRTEYVFESEEHVRNWLMKVTANECRKFWRRPFRNFTIRSLPQIVWAVPFSINLKSLPTPSEWVA